MKNTIEQNCRFDAGAKLDISLDDFLTAKDNEQKITDKFLELLKANRDLPELDGAYGVETNICEGSLSTEYTEVLVCGDLTFKVEYSDGSPETRYSPADPMEFGTEEQEEMKNELLNVLEKACTECGFKPIEVAMYNIEADSFEKLAERVGDKEYEYGD